MALAVLRGSEEQATWDLYHQIGDVLRSDEMAFSLSDGFAAKMSARLDAEPTIIAPQLKTSPSEQIVVPVAVSGGNGVTSINSGTPRKRFMRRFVVPGAAVAAAVVAVVFVTAPQQSVVVAENATSTPAMVSPAAVTTVAATSGPTRQAAAAASISSLAQQGDVTRDPRMDDYLLAHQRFSPSMYSSAQYARSAAFAIDSDK